MIRGPKPIETVALLKLAELTGIFQPGEVDALLGEVLRSFHAGELGEHQEVTVWAETETSEPSGWAYFSPSEKAPGVWDLWWIGVNPKDQSSGVGKRLLEDAEKKVRQRAGRILIIETNTTPTLARTREFYRRRGYTDCGTVPDFYGPGEGKVTFAKTL